MKYPVKVWLLTILISPLVLIILSSFRNGANFRDFESSLILIFYMIIFSLLFSSPSLLLFWLLSDELNGRAIKARNKKLILCSAGFVLIWTSFFLIDKNLFTKWSFNNYKLPLSYSFVLLLLIITLKPTVSEK